MTANDTPTTDTAQDTTNTPKQDAQAPSTPEQDPTPQEAPQAGQERSRANTEAAKYRVRAKKAEASLQDLQERYDDLLKSTISAHLHPDMPAPVFWKFVDDPLQFIGEGGGIDAKRVKERSLELAKEIGLALPRGPYVPDIAETPKLGPRPAWNAILKGEVED